MTGILLCAAWMFAGVTDKPLSYQQAHHEAMASKRPMLILVGADWCPACRVMKHSTLPALQRQGKLKDVVFTIVDVDQQPKLASQLMRSSSIPQLVLYTPKSEGWYRMYLHGSQEPARITGMIARGLQLQRDELAAKQRSTNPDPTDSVADE